MDSIFEKNLITTKNAGELSGYSSDYLARLARSGKIDGKRIGHSWLIDKESLVHFLDQQGGRKIDYARALSRAREAEYRERHSILHSVAETLSKPISLPASIGGNALRSQVLASSVAFIVIAFGAFVANASTMPQAASRTIEIAREAAFGFKETFGNVPSDIASKINATAKGMRSASPRLRKASALALRSFSEKGSPFLSDLRFSSLHMALAEDHDAFRIHYPTEHVMPAMPANAQTFTIVDMQSSANSAYAFVAHPSLIVRAFADAYVTIGLNTYTAFVASFATYHSLIEQSGTGSLAFAVTARDMLASAPHLVSHMNLAFGHSIITGAHAAIGADVAVAYGTSEMVPAGGRTVLALVVSMGDVLAHATARTTVEAPARIALVLRSFSEAGPALAQAVFSAEYAGASRFVALADSASEQYALAVRNSGEAGYASVVGINSLVHASRTFLAAAPAAIEDAYLGALGKSALVLDSFIRMPKISATLAAAAPAFSTGEQIALATYQIIHGFFDSVNRTLATLLGPPPSIVLPTIGSKSLTTGNKETPKSVIATSSTTPSTSPGINHVTYSSPTYTTVVKGVSEDFMNQSLASLRANVLAAVAGMIQPVSRQVATNATTIQQVNMIQKLDSLIVTNGDFRGGIFDNGIRVSATDGSFSNLSAGTTTLATATITSDLSVLGTVTSPAIIATNSTTTNATTTGSFALTSATPARLLSVTINGVATSSNLSSWLAGTANQITMTDNGAGGLTASLPSLLALTYASSTALSALNTLSVGQNATTTIAGDGNTSTFYGPLTVRGTTSQASALTLQRGNSNGDNSITFNDQVGSPLLKIYTDANSGNGRIVGYQTYLTLGMNTGGTVLSIDTSHNVNATANLIPTATLTYDLGSPTEYWNNGYVSNIWMNGTTGLSLSGAGAGLTFSGSGNHDITASGGTLRLGSNVVIGNIQALDGTISIGTPTVRFNKMYADEVNATTLVGTLTGGNLTAETFRINSDNVSSDQENSFLTFERGSVTPDAALEWNAATSSKRFEFNQPLYIQDVSHTSATSTLLVQGWSGQTTDIFRVASSSAETNSYFNVTSNGNVGIGTTNSPTAKLQIVGGGIALDGAQPISFYSTNYKIQANTGLEFWSNDVFRFFTGATEKFRISTSGGFSFGNSYVATDPGAGNMIISGNVGIGTTIPATKLDITQNAIDSGLRIRHQGFPSTYYGDISYGTVNPNFGFRFKNVGAGADAAFMFYQDNTELMRITTTGNVGIGTTSPLTKLSIQGTAGANDVLNVASSTGASMLYVNAAGNIGIGTTSPYSLLSINNSVSTAANTPLFTIASTTAGTATSTFLTVLAAGNVVVGSSAPAATGYMLNVTGQSYFSSVLTAASINSATITGSTGGNVQFGNVSTGGDVFLANNTEAMRITSNGNVGIGTTSPAAQLNIVKADSSGLTDVLVNPTIKTSGNLLDLQVGGAHKLQVNLNGSIVTNDIYIGYGGIDIIGNSSHSDMVHFNGENLQLMDGGQGGTGNISMVMNGGRVGIGTTTPASILDIYGTDAVHLPVGTSGQRPSMALIGQVRYNVSTHQFEGYGDNSVWQGLGGVVNAAQTTYITAGADDYLRFVTASVERMTITNAGLIGIGTTTPMVPLDIANSKTGINIWAATTTNYKKANIGYSNSVATDVFTISTNAPVGGTYQDIQIVPNNGSGNTGLYLNTSGQAGLGYTTFADTTIGNAFLVNGRLGIGTTTPSNALTIITNGRATGDLRYGMQIINSDYANTQATNIAFLGQGGSGGNKWIVGTDVNHNNTNAFFIATSTGPGVVAPFLINGDSTIQFANLAATPSATSLRLYEVNGALWFDSTQLTAGTSANYWSHTPGNTYNTTLTDKIGIGTATPGAALDVRGSIAAPSDTYTKLLLHMDGTNAATTFVDETGKTVVVGGNAQISTAQSKFGGASGLFDGSYDYVEFANSDDWNFGTGNFTIDFWMKTSDSSTDRSLVEIDKSGNHAPSLYGLDIATAPTTGVVNAYFSDGTHEIHASSAIISTNNFWHHIAVVRNGTTLTLYRDGVAGATVGNIGTYSMNFDANFKLEVGARYGGDLAFNGWIDEVRVSKGIARWTTDFYPPARPYSTIDSNFFAQQDNLFSALTTTSTGDGNVGIGTQDLTYRLNVVGDATGWGISINDLSGSHTNGLYSYGTTWSGYFQGPGYLSTSAWSYGSDRRLKENISYLDNISGLDKILQLKPAKFDYITGEKNQLGFIAQDVQSVIPEAVSIIDPATGMLGFKTDFIIPYLVNATKELSAKIDLLSASSTISQYVVNNYYSTSTSTTLGTSTPTDLSGLVSTSTLNSVLGGYALLTNIPDVSGFVTTGALAQADFVSTSTLASALSSYSTTANMNSAIASAITGISLQLATSSLQSTVTNSLIPSTDNAYALGSPTNRFSDVYAKNVNAGDLTFTETASAVSGNTLQVGDTIGLYVTSTSGSTHTVPIDFRTAINTTSYGANNIYFNTSGKFGIGVASTTALKGKLDVEGAITAGNDSRLLTFANTSALAALPYSAYIAPATGDLTIASNDDSLGSRINTSYPVWQIGLNGASDSFSVNRAAAGAGTFSASTLFKIASNGNVGIGTSSPMSLLSVAGTITANNINATSTAATSTFSGGLSAASSLYVLQNGNVGVGTAGPVSILNVKGASSDPAASTQTGVFRIESPTTGLNMGLFTTAPYGIWMQTTNYPATAAGTFPLSLNPLGGNVGIGTAAPATKLQINDGTDQNILFQGGSGTIFGAGIGMAIKSLNNAINAFEPMEFAASKFDFTTGNVGIGITPIVRTHIFGTSLAASLSSNNEILKVEGSSGPSLAIGGDPASPFGMYLQTKYNSTTWPLNLNPLGGGVTIGTTVVGADSGYTTTRLTVNGGGGAVFFKSGVWSDSVQYVWNATTENNGSFIGFMTEAGAGTIRGTIGYNRAGGLVAYNTTSDARLKNILGDASTTQAMGRLSQIQVRNYEWKETPGVSHVGFVAQELYQVEPEAVTVGGDDPQKKPWQIDRSALIPDLVLGFQALNSKFLVPMDANASSTPSAILTADGREIDVYKLATYVTSNVQALATRINGLDTRMTSLETRVAALESGAVSSSSSSPISFSSSTIASALSGFGVLIQKGIAQFGTLVADQFVAATNSAGTSSAGTVTILAGNTVAQVTNAYVKPSSKIFVTLTASTTGSWYISDKQDGSFKLVLSEPQTGNVSFDYFLVQTEGQVATSSPETASGSTSSTPDHTPPVMTLLGANPIRISVGGVFADPGVSVTDNVDPSTSFGAGGTNPVATYINGVQAEVSSATIDTSKQGNYIITYQATDHAGNKSETATRSVIIANAPSSDITPPVVTLIGDAAMEMNATSTPFADPGATATDDVDGDLTAKVVETGTVNTTTPNLYTLTYTATDTAGNNASVSRVVTVVATSTTSSGN